MSTRKLRSNFDRFISRTRGISTTDIVGRLLLNTRAQLASDARPTSNLASDLKSQVKRSPYTGLMKFIPTTQKLVEFSQMKEPKSGDKIGYISGSFDLFRNTFSRFTLSIFCLKLLQSKKDFGHMEILRVAKECVDFLYVGLTEDAVVTRTKGPAFPIMNLHERALSALACRVTLQIHLISLFINSFVF